MHLTSRYIADPVQRVTRSAAGTQYVHDFDVQAHDIETALWKWVYYKPIEEFRHRVRFAADAGEKGEEPLRKVWQCAQPVGRRHTILSLVLHIPRNRSV